MSSSLHVRPKGVLAFLAVAAFLYALAILVVYVILFLSPGGSETRIAAQSLLLNGFDSVDLLATPGDGKSVAMFRLVPAIAYIYAFLVLFFEATWLASRVKTSFRTAYFYGLIMELFLSAAAYSRTGVDQGLLIDTAISFALLLYLTLSRTVISVEESQAQWMASIGVEKVRKGWGGF